MDGSIMKYDLYQIRLTDEQIAEVNASAGETPEFYKKYISLTISPTSLKVFDARDMYSKVAVIEADNLEQVFRIGNMGPESAITRLAGMKSVSVGDVVVDRYGAAYVCATFGWNEVEGFMTDE
jgi:hypothetical protein